MRRPSVRKAWASAKAWSGSGSRSPFTTCEPMLPGSGIGAAPGFGPSQPMNTHERLTLISVGAAAYRPAECQPG